MGYYTKKIVKEDKELLPKTISLASNPNFVQFESYEKDNEKFITVSLRIISPGYVADNPESGEPKMNYSAFIIKERVGEEPPVHTFKGRSVEDTDSDMEGYDNIFTLDSEDLSATASSLKDCLSANSFFSQKFNISISPKDNTVINLTSKGNGEEYTFELNGEDDYFPFFAEMTGDSTVINPSLPEKIDISIKVVNPNVLVDQTSIKIEEVANQKTYSFVGTKEAKEVNSVTFFLAENDSITTAENIKACLMKNSFLRSNFEITIPPIRTGSEVGNGDTIRIVSKGTGIRYAFRFVSPDKEDTRFIKVSGDPSNTVNSDSISEDKSDCEIELDIYSDTDVFPGEQDDTKLGTYITTISKAYFNKPLWFDVNAIAANRKTFSTDFMDKAGWCNAGTASDYRFVAKRFDGTNHETFYVSDVFYTINGYNRNLEKNDLDAYVYKADANNIVKPLTRQPELTHIEGQKQFFNFIYSDPNKDQIGSWGNKFGIIYKLYSQSGNYLGEKKAHETIKMNLHIVNTIVLDIDSATMMYSNVGLVEVFLCRDDKTISEPLKFRILPSCLYEVRDFAFLNSLGGWSSFNFGGTKQTDFKASGNTFFKTQTPAHNYRSDIESVSGKSIEEQFVVETIPIDSHTADWLKEISSSLAVYELSTERYVIIDELNVKHNTRDDLFTLQMKYHYSDSYNAGGKGS